MDSPQDWFPKQGASNDAHGKGRRSSIRIRNRPAIGADNVVAQSSGCPWCTTPTTCAEVPENTSIGGCYNFGYGCRTVSGVCTIEETFAAVGRKQLLADNGLEFHGVQLINVLGVDIEATGVGGGLFARWGCGGAVVAVFMRDAHSAEWIELDPRLYSRTLDLNIDTSPAGASATES